MSLKKYAVIGHPMGHTMSPFIHKRLFELSGIQAQYGVFDIAPEDLDNQYKNVLSKLDGFNITIPHKQRIIHLLDNLDPKAKMYGSVNTVAFGEKGACGYTTDPDGFLKALEAENIAPVGRVVILGCGGVARTMAYEAALKDADLSFAVRKEDTEVCKNLCKEIKDTLNKEVGFCGLSEIEGDIDLLVNATPIGMYPKIDAQPVEDKVLSKTKALFDAVYNPLETQLIKKAKAMGCKALGGMSMLVWQAVVAHEIWDNSKYDKQDIDKLCLDAAAELRNK